MHRLYQVFATICITFALTGCATPPTQIPPWLVLLTPAWPSTEGICSGFVVAPKTIVTARHCVESVQRAVTTRGQEALIVSSIVSDKQDVAVLTTDRILLIDTFAKFGRAELNTDTTVLGYCPFQVSYVPRHAFYNGIASIVAGTYPERDYDSWILPTIPGTFNQLCGGDSGSALVEHGKVVGILSAVESEYWFVALGSVAYSVPSSYAQELLDR